MGAVLTQVKMEKKEKVMAARAASVPSFRGLSLGLETCHWLARKQKPTNQKKAQKAEVPGPGRTSVTHIEKGEKTGHQGTGGQFKSVSPCSRAHK